MSARVPRLPPRIAPLAAALLLVGCGTTPRLAEWRATSYCIGTLEGCTSDARWHETLDPAALRPDDAIVARHEASNRPAGSSVRTDAAMNVVRLEPLCARATAEAAPRRAGAGDLDDTDPRCDLLVERRRGHSYRVWNMPVLVGDPSAAADALLRRALPTFSLVAVFLVVAFQQALAALRGAQREGAALVALVAVSGAARIGAQRRDVLGHDLAAYRVEIVAGPVAAFGLVSFLWWLCRAEATSLRRAYPLACGFLAAILLLVPLGGSAQLLAVRTLEAFIVMSAIAVAVEGYRLRERVPEDERRLLLTGVVALVIGSVFDTVMFLVVGDLPPWLPMGLTAIALAVFVATLAAVLAARNARAHEGVARLAGDLTAKNAELAVASDELSRRNDELRRASAAKDTLVANTSHELRTPLHGIMGLVDLTRQEEGLSEGARRNLDLTLQSARRLNALVCDLLDFSRMARTRIPVFPAPVKLSSVVAFVCDLLRPTVASDSVVLEAAVDSDLPNVHADPQRLQQVLVNLLGNAIRFTKRGSIRVYAKHEAGVVTVFVRDTGIGISKDAQRTIFDAFQQVDGSAAREASGTGLGLAIVKGIVDAHGGQVSVQSTPGMGATFSFTLEVSHEVVPARDDELPPSGAGLVADRIAAIALDAQARPAATPAGEPHAADLARKPRESIMASSLDVLVVDDEEVNREVLRQKLETMGHRVREAEGGEEALDEIRRVGPPDLMLLDVMMPRVTGLDVLRRVRETFDVAALPVILLTARAQQKDLVEGFDTGANDYVLKPFSIAELGARVALQGRVIAATRSLERTRTLNTSAAPEGAQREARLVHLERLAELGTALAGVAHDLVAPLHHVHSGLGLSVSRAEALRAHLTDDAQGARSHADLLQFLDVAKEGASAAMEFATSVRDFAGTGDTATGTPDVAQAVAAARRLTHHKTRAYEVTCRVPESIDALVGRVELTQVVMNLIGNAAESLAGESRASGRIDVSAEITERTVRLYVDDDGPGVPEGLRDRVFDPFFTTKPSGVGTGLGLAVCRTIVQREGGSVTCTRSPSLGGARFTVDLPRRRAK